MPIDTDMDDTSEPSTLEEGAKKLASEVLSAAITESELLSGGDSCEVWRLETPRCDALLKLRSLGGSVDNEDGFFQAEQQGLHELTQGLRRSAGQDVGHLFQSSIRTPEVLYTDKSIILMEWLEPAQLHTLSEDKKQRFNEQLAEGLARLHNSEVPAFGFHNDNFCGVTPQLNQQMRDGYEFYATQRLLPQGKWARDKGLINHACTMKLDRLAARLKDYIPSQKPGVLHGDLWSGNVLCVEDGVPALIDPACYWGWPESDIAMTVLFGGFDADFYQNYKAIIPSAEGFDERVPVYNLYHVLNHLNIFGGSYKGHVEAILGRFA